MSDLGHGMSGQAFAPRIGFRRSFHQPFGERPECPLAWKRKPARRVGPRRHLSGNGHAGRLGSARQDGCFAPEAVGGASS